MQDRIELDAEDYSNKYLNGRVNAKEFSISVDGYIAGATAEHNRAQPLVDMLMNVRAFIAGATAGAMHHFTSLKTLDKEIEAVLQQWNGTGKEVENA